MERKKNENKLSWPLVYDLEIFILKWGPMIWKWKFPLGRIRLGETETRMIIQFERAAEKADTVARN